MEAAADRQDPVEAVAEPLAAEPVALVADAVTDGAVLRVGDAIPLGPAVPGPRRPDATEGRP